MITNSDECAAKVRSFISHGVDRDAWQRYSDKIVGYQVTDYGYNYRMTDIQAALGLWQLARLEARWQRRKEISEKYDREFRHSKSEIWPTFDDWEQFKKDIRHAYHLYHVQLDPDVDRDWFVAEMSKRNIGVGIHYIAMHLHPFYRDKFGYKCGNFPNAEYISDHTISLPLSAGMTDQDVQDVIDAVCEILN